MRRSFAHAVIRQRLSPDAVRIPFVVYITEAASVRASTVGASGLRRATTARVQEAQGEIVAALRANPPNLPEGTRVGEIAMNVWSRSRARDPNASAIDVRELPASNTFRQAIRLDYLQANNEAEQREWAEMPIRFNRTEPVTVEMHIPTLRSILGLPRYPLFNGELFHSDAPLPTTVGRDIEDTDHPVTDSD